MAKTRSTWVDPNIFEHAEVRALAQAVNGLADLVHPLDSIAGTVIAAGDGEIVIRVHRDTNEYPAIGSTVVVSPRPR